MRLCILLLAVAMAASGQEKKPEEMKPDTSNYEAAIIPVKTLTGDSFERLVKLLNVFNARYSADDKLRTIIVYGPKDVVAEMRRVIAELDRPGSDAAIGRNIDLLLTFLRCSIKPAPNPVSLPGDLEAVAKQLRAATQYKDIQLWESVPMHIQEGKASDQRLRLPGGSLSATHSVVAMGHISVWPESVGLKDGARFVRFREMKVDFQIPVGVAPSIHMLQERINTAGDFMENQKTVLGKVSGADDESAIFVVISLKILD
jgi:hypothetical protein